MMRYIRSLERKDIGLDTSMIPLGSCTMKLNATTEMLPSHVDCFQPAAPVCTGGPGRGIHAGVPGARGGVVRDHGVCGGLVAAELGSSGRVHRAHGDSRVPPSIAANPAATWCSSPPRPMAPIRPALSRPACVSSSFAARADGSVDVEDLRAKAAQHREHLACLMITYPSTHGVFEDDIRRICDIVHEHGGQVYMDGANMNAQVGLTSPATIGADVCHLNLHKTFAIPHGGGGPGMGPIGVARHLAPFLPGHPLVSVGGENAIHAVSAAPWGSASILLISYAYVRMLGADGLTDATRHAILNANYIKARLERHYPVLYSRANGRVAHELIFDLRAFKAGGVEEMDVAKRLIDFGFHAPTVSFPVAGTLMVEPTESEDKAELDRFCDAMIAIRAEIEDVITGKVDSQDNVLKNAPHTAAVVTATEWRHPYTREQAAFPLPFVRERKYWPPVGRIDNTYGDRNLFCSCPPLDDPGSTQ